MSKKVIFTTILALITSIAIDIIFQQITGHVPACLTYVKFLFLLSTYTLSIFTARIRQFSGFILVLMIITLVNLTTGLIQKTHFWQSAFDTATFSGNFGSSILLKLIGIIPVACVLLILLRSGKEFYLCKGDLKRKADKISWLGIKPDSISWGKLSVISAILISFGTILLTIFTVTNLSTVKGISGFLGCLPLIILLALANSFCEGLLFRSAILGTLKNILPKDPLILIAAMFFGIGHYYGAPSGIVGVAMSGLLGWYMCRSMYETKGFASSWIIHFAQDVVIFSTIYLLGNFT